MISEVGSEICRTCVWILPAVLPSMKSRLQSIRSMILPLTNLKTCITHDTTQQYRITMALMADETDMT